MKTSTQVVLLATSLVMIFESCTMQDHLQPEVGASTSCLISERRDSDVLKLEPGSVLKIGDDFPNGGFSSKITDIIDVDGQKYALSSLGETVDQYNYDAQKRVIEYTYLHRLVRGARIYTYTYEPGKVIRKSVQEGFPVNTSTDTYTLNEHGIIPEENVTYNAEGYEIERRNLYQGMVDSYVSYTIVNGNKVASESEAFGPATNGKYSSTSEFDLTKPNLPNPLPFNGKTNRNLFLRSTLTNAKDPDFKVLGENRYTFDSQGNVIQVISISSFNDGHKTVAATRYQYTCP